MHIVSVATAFPGPRHQQCDLLAALIAAWGERVSDRERQLLERLAKSAGVEGKHLAMAPYDYSIKTSFTERNRIFQLVSHDLGVQSISSVLEAVGAAPDSVDAIFFTTVTGISVPSVDALIAGSIGLRDDIKRIPLFGLGCVGGVAGLARVHDYLQSWPDHVVLLLAVELCSLTLQIDDLSPESIIASALFGDGAAAVLCVGRNNHLAGLSRLETLVSRSRLYPNTRHIMGWDVGSHGFKILLDPGVPQIVKEYFADDVRRFLVDQNLRVGDIRSWISHPGGPKVLQAIESSLELPEKALEISRSQLSRVGNLSSASVLGVLRETLLQEANNITSPPIGRSGDHALMMAMGPGFCSEQLLCRWI